MAEIALQDEANQAPGGAGLSGLSSIVDTLGSMHLDEGLGSASWAKTLGLDTYGAGLSGLSSIVDTLGSMHLDEGLGSASWAKTLGLDTYGGTSTFAAALAGRDAFGGFANIAIENRLGAPWIKELRGGGDTYGLGLSSSHEIVEVPGLSLSSQPVEMDPDLFAYGGLDSGEMTFDIFKLGCSADDFVAVVVTMAFVTVALLLHAQGLDWAATIVGAIYSVLVSRR